MKIRSAIISDIIKVSRLWMQMVTELAPELTPNAYWWRVQAESALKQDNYFMYVAEEGGKIIGFIDYFLFAEPATGMRHCVGQHFFVLPEYRGGSTSASLWKTVMRVSKAQGSQIWELFCFEKEKEFWGKKGFSQKRCLVRKELRGAMNGRTRAMSDTVCV